MKKKLIGLLTLIMATGLILSACGSSSDSASKDPDAPYEIVWYTIGTPQKDKDKVFKKVNEYLEKKINATVKMVQVDWGDYDQKMQVKIASGEPFDLAFTNGTNYVQQAQKGAFLALDDLLDTHGKDLKKALDPTLIEGAKVDGKLYGIPANKEVARQEVYLFNKSLVDKYNFDISKVKTLKDLEPMLKTVKESEPDFTPIATFDAYLPFDYLMGEEFPMAIPFEGNTDKIINWYDTDKAMEIFKTMHHYYKEGYIKADAATSKDTWPMDVENWFVRMEGYQPYADLLWSRSAKYDVVSTPLEEPVANNESVTGSIQAISATSENPEKVMDFLNLMNTDPYLRNLIDRGIEGVHYEKADDGTITDLPARVKQYNMPSYSLGNEFVLYLYNDDPKDKWEKFKEFNKKAKRAPSLGFHFDPSKVRTEIAAVTNVSEQFYDALATGSVDPEKYLPKANKKFEEAGLDKIIKEAQKQFDAWKKANK